MKQEKWDGTLTHALERAAQGDQGETEVGWRVLVGVHPANVDQILLGAQRETDGKTSHFVIGRADVLKPYTDVEVRAMIMHQWGRQDAAPPEVVRLTCAQLVVEAYRASRALP